MKLFFSIAFIFSALTAFAAPSVDAIIERARATVGDEASLGTLITFKVVGKIKPVDPKVPEANIVILARKPSSQRLEVRVGDLVESTILRGSKGCIVRSNEAQEGPQATQMRLLSEEELERVQYNTRQFFSFFEPNYKEGETVKHAGIEQHRGVRCHKLVYSHPDGMQITRYFAVNDDTLVSTMTDKGVESVEVESVIVEGIKFPKKVEYYDNHKKLHTIEFASIEANIPLPAGIFDIPKAKEN